VKLKEEYRRNPTQFSPSCVTTPDSSTTVLVIDGPKTSDHSARKKKRNKAIAKGEEGLEP